MSIMLADYKWRSAILSATSYRQGWRANASFVL